MKTLHRLSYIEVTGPIWWPAGAVCAQRIVLSGYDIENIRGYSHRDAADEDIPNLPITREGVDLWLGCHAGDFNGINDFAYSIEDGDDTRDSAWDDPDSDMTYCMAMSDDE